MAMPRWVWAVIIVVALFVIGILAMAGAGVYFVTRQVQITTAAPADADQRFAEARERFKDAKPLIELDRDGEVLRSRLEEAQDARTGPTTSLDALHILAWDADDERIVDVAVPFWLLRLNRGPIGQFDDAGGLRRANLRITAEDLERIGPALLVDHRDPEGGRVLVWTQ
jgi:uncharacterized membrane protein